MEDKLPFGFGQYDVIVCKSEIEIKKVINIASQHIPQIKNTTSVDHIVRRLRKDQIVLYLGYGTLQGWGWDEYSNVPDPSTSIPAYQFIEHHTGHSVPTPEVPRPTVLSVRILQVGRDLRFKVLKQNVGIFKRGKFRYTASNGWKVISDDTPEFHAGHGPLIFLQGRQGHTDNNECIRTFSSPEEALKVRKDMIKALKEATYYAKNK